MPGLERTPRPTSAAAAPAEFSSFVALGLSQPYSRLVEAGWAGACRRVRLQAMQRTKGPNFRQPSKATHGCMARLHGPDELMAKADRARASNARLLRRNRPRTASAVLPTGEGLGRGPRPLDLPRERRSSG
jgi:hypothetical protein